MATTWVISRLYFYRKFSLFGSVLSNLIFIMWFSCSSSYVILSFCFSVVLLFGEICRTFSANPVLRNDFPRITYTSDELFRLRPVAGANDGVNDAIGTLMVIVMLQGNQENVGGKED